MSIESQYRLKIIGFKPGINKIAAMRAMMNSPEADIEQVKIFYEFLKTTGLPLAADVETEHNARQLADHRTAETGIIFDVEPVLEFESDLESPDPFSAVSHATASPTPPLKAMPTWRQNINTWGTILFGLLMGGGMLYEFFFKGH